MCFRFLYFQLPAKNMVYYMFSINDQTKEVHHGTLKNTDSKPLLTTFVKLSGKIDVYSILKKKMHQISGIWA